MASDFEIRTALLLRRALDSLSREYTRRQSEARYRPEGEEMWWLRQVEFIRQWSAQ